MGSYREFWMDATKSSKRANKQKPLKNRVQHLGAKDCPRRVPSGHIPEVLMVRQRPESTDRSKQDPRNSKGPDGNEGLLFRDRNRHQR